MRPYISARNLTADQFATIEVALVHHLGLNALVQNCTPRGNGKQIKSNKPKDGVYAYVWRMARFHSGVDTCLPIMADIDLSRGLEALTGLNVNFAITSGDYTKLIFKILDKAADDLIEQVGASKFSAAKRWGQALGVYA